MLETLQTDDGRDGKAVGAVRPNELIIDSGYCDIVTKFIDEARGEIRICAYAWRWYESSPEESIQRLNMALIRAKWRGVDIRVIADSQATLDTLRTLGIKARGVEKNKLMHTKAFCFDMNTLVLGSHNLTKRATRDNYEMSIATSDYSIIDQFVQYFDRLWAVRG